MSSNHTPATLFPQLHGEERERADDDFDAYLNLVLRIYEYAAADPERLAKLEELLTASER